MSDKELSSFINKLTEDLKPTKNLKHPILRAVPIIILIGLYLYALTSNLGVRADAADKMHDMGFMAEMGLSLFIALAGIFAIGWLSYPDIRQQKWVIYPPILSGIVFVGWLLYQGINERLMEPHIDFHHCSSDFMGAALVPTALLVLMCRKGATTRPILTGIMCALAGGAAGWIAIRFACPVDIITHTFTYHFLPFILLGVIVGFAAKFLFKW